MHYYYSILLTALIAQSGICSAKNYFEWTQERVTLTSETPSWTLEMVANGTEYTIDVDNATDSAYSIFVWIDKMSCRIVEDTFEPNYMKITSDKIIADLDVCENLTMSKPSPYNNGIDNVGLRKVKLTPIGVWANVSTSVSLRVEMRMKKTIIMGSDIPQLDLTLDGSVDYEIQLNKKDKLCNQPLDDGRSWNCSLSLAFTQMTCSLGTLANLQLDWTNLAGHNDSAQWCDDFMYASSNLKSIESFDSIFLSPLGNITQHGTKPIKVSISAQLSTEDDSSCPAGYFNCNENCYSSKSSENDKKDFGLLGSHCIPTEWTCDNKPNCPKVCPDADESDSYCTNWWYYEFYTNGLFTMWQFFFFFMFTLGFLTIFCVFRSLCLHRVKNRRNVRSVEGQVPRTRTDLPPPSYSKATGMPLPTYT